MTEPMSDEQLELYRAMLSGNKYEHGVPLSSARVLLAEVDRLRQREAELEGDVEHRRKALEHANTRVDYLKAQNAAMREIVRQVADADTYVWGLALPVHPKDADKLKAQARALMTQWDEPAE